MSYELADLLRVRALTWKLTGNAWIEYYGQFVDAYAEYYRSYAATHGSPLPEPPK